MVLKKSDEKRVYIVAQIQKEKARTIRKFIMQSNTDAVEYSNIQMSPLINRTSIPCLSLNLQLVMPFKTNI